jgi:hypothetical protein
MPAQQRRWRHHESMLAPVREQSSERSDERTIGGSKPRALMLTSQNRELVAQQHQLHVLGELGSPTANEQPQDSSKGKVSEGEEHRAILPGPANPPQSWTVLAPFSGSWYSRARVTQQLGRGSDPPSRERTPTRSRVHYEYAEGPGHGCRTHARTADRSFDTLQAESLAPRAASNRTKSANEGDNLGRG